MKCCFLLFTVWCLKLVIHQPLKTQTRHCKRSVYQKSDMAWSIFGHNSFESWTVRVRAWFVFIYLCICSKIQCDFSCLVNALLRLSPSRQGNSLAQGTVTDRLLNPLVPPSTWAFIAFQSNTPYHTVGYLSLYELMYNQWWKSHSAIEHHGLPEYFCSKLLHFRHFKHLLWGDFEVIHCFLS